MAESKVDKALQQLFKRSVATKVLWSNASPTSAFPAQTINAQCKGYDKILLECGYSKTDVDFEKNFAAGTGKKAILEVSAGAAYTNTGYYTRNAEVADTGVIIKDCYKKNMGASTGGSIDNAYLIPQKIYGIILSGGGAA